MSIFTNFIHGINAILVMIVLGAALGAVCWLVSRLVTGIMGIGICAAAGAVMLLGVHWTGAIESMASDATKAKIAQLEADKAKLAHDIQALNEVRTFESQQAADQAKQLQDEKDKVSKVEAIIALHAGDTSQCVFQDELNEIFK